jgi:hypothetical protein
MQCCVALAQEFWWDSVRKYIVAEDVVLEAYVQVKF